MKLFLTILTLIGTLSLTAQTLQPFSPARGHYKQFQGLSPNPKAGAAALDDQRFPIDKVVAEKRLSLKPYYLSDNIDFELPEPPANSSDQTRAELNYLLALQHSRTQLDITNALYMAKVYYNPRVLPTDSTYTRFRKNLFYIGRSIGTWFNPETLPVTADFMAHVWQDASFYIWTYKYKFLRIRPYKIEPALKNLEETNWAAYPSGHAANSYLIAYIYSVLAPEFTDVFMKDAYDMAHSREIIGVHYPSDSETSRLLAHKFVSALFQNEKFKQELLTAQREWKEKGFETFSEKEKP